MLGLIHFQIPFFLTYIQLVSQTLIINTLRQAENIQYVYV